MEGPSLFLAAEQLKPFVGKTILEVQGNTKIGKEKMLKRKVLDIFSWGKHLVFQFDTFALRVHFLLYGSFEATVDQVKVTGDYPKKNRTARLSFTFKNGSIEMYSCSLKYHEESHLKSSYDYTIDIMSPFFDIKKALLKLQSYPDDQIGDLLLDQTSFAGVGNIIKNEVLFIERVTPEKKVKELSKKKLIQIIQTTKSFSQQFYEWRKIFELKKHYQIYRKSACPVCKGKVSRRKTGVRQRFSFICLHCQK